MKKIYMILAALSLLSLSLNAQLLPANQLGGFCDFTPTGKAYHKAPNGKLRMPTLASNEYLVGPYVTDDFDATGIGYGNYYSNDQSIAVMVELPREEFASHIGDSIIGFRFALAGSTATPVFDFMAWTRSANYIDVNNRHTWELADLVAGNTSSSTGTITNSTNATFEPSGSSQYYIRSKTVNGVTINSTAGDFGYDDYITLNGTTTISTTSGTITKIVFNGYDEDYPVTRLSTSTGSYTTSNNVGTWTGNASSLTLTSSSYVDCSSIIVTVETTTTTTLNSVEIGNGNVQDEELPAYGYWHDRGYKNQMIYRAEQLCMAANSQITSLTFYPEEGQGIPFAGSTVTVRLANTDSYNFGSGTTGSMITSGLTTVATITPVADHDATAWTINFSSPFTYTGGNLVVQLECPGYMNDGTDGQYGHCFFRGDNQSSNVSIKVSGTSAQTATSGPTSKFLPKTKFTFAGSIETHTYMTLEGGQWHDFFLDEPVVFAAGDTIQSLMIGYEYYQYTGSSHTPTAVNSNSTGHSHRSFMYAYNGSSYVQGWWNDGVSGSSNADRPGDLSVQLIFKNAMPKTPQPTITVTSDNGYYYITATADPSTPNAQVTLTVGGQTATSAGSVTIPVGRLNDQDQTVQASATAQESGMQPSDPTTQTITVQASPLEPTPTPSIASQKLDATVQVTGSGEGDVHMYIDGREVNNPYYLERTDQDYYVTVTVTAQINDGEHSMSSTTQQVLVPALSNLDLTGWTQLPGTYSNSSVINWNDNLMFVDRFTASTANNDQKLSYKYVMTEDDIKLIGEPRTTNDHTIPVQWTNSKVFGYYTEQQVTDDRDRQHVDIDVMNANVEMNLAKNTDVYYYTLDRNRNSIADANFLELSELQYDGNRYVEQDNFFTLHEPFYFNEGANNIAVQRYDQIDMVLPASAPQGTNGKHYGKYDQGDYMPYVPIVWTWGNQVANKRAYWDRDSIHNSYGSPIWKTGVGKVTMQQPDVEKQIDPKWHTTDWTEGTTKCNLYMITDLVADGYLPSREVSNIKYEPYMFRVWVESKNHKLRGYKWVPNEENEGQHCVSTNQGALDGPICIWEEKFENSANVTFDEATGIATFHKVKADRENDNVVWTIPEEMNIMFGAVDEIQEGDITIYVRFYYKSTGKSIFEKTTAPMLRADGDEEPEVPMFYAAEGSDDPDNEHITTGINGVFTGSHGEIVGVTYVNAQGMQSDKPFDGLNIVITRYSDGTTTNTKVIR